MLNETAIAMHLTSTGHRIHVAMHPSHSTNADTSVWVDGVLVESDRYCPYFVVSDIPAACSRLLELSKQKAPIEAFVAVLDTVQALGLRCWAWVDEMDRRSVPEVQKEVIEALLRTWAVELSTHSTGLDGLLLAQIDCAELAALVRARIESQMQLEAQDRVSLAKLKEKIFV